MVRIGSKSGSEDENMNFMIAMGAVASVTDPGLSTDARGALLIDLLKRVVRGSNDPEVDGKLATYRMELSDDTFVMTARKKDD